MPLIYNTVLWSETKGNSHETTCVNGRPSRRDAREVDIADPSTPTLA